MSRLAFATADDPFYKSTVSRYYPEAIVFDKAGNIITRIGPNNPKGDHAINYFEDFRDKALKINDDRKIQIQINQYKEQGTMILLTVRYYRNKEGGRAGPDDDYKRAWVRLSNEETNQTVDYSMINKIEVPESYTPTVTVGEDDEAQTKDNELVYLMGIIHLEEITKAGNTWVFESYKHAIPSQAFDFKDVGEGIGAIYGKAMTNADNQAKQLAECEVAIKKAAEQRRKEEEERAAAKKKKGKKGKDEPESALPADAGSPVKRKSTVPTFDKTKPDGFKGALEYHVRRPYLFGPVEFEGLDLSEEQQAFNAEEERKRVTDVLERGVGMPPGLCIHGYSVTVKDRNLKRRSSLLKHARFLRNLQVKPQMPVVVEEAPVEDAEED